MKLQEHPQIERRMLFIRIFTGAMFFFLFIGFWHTQIISGKKYFQLAQSNSLRTITLSPPRGIIRDREGEILADNSTVFNLLLDREKKENISSAIKFAADFLGISEDILRTRIERYSELPSHHPAPLAENISFSQMAHFASRALEYPALTIQPVKVRHYPQGALMAHTLGHVGEITQRQLNTGFFPNAVRGDVVGQAGLEYQYDHLLRGKRGSRRVIVDSVGREVLLLQKNPPEPGNETFLTVSATLSRAIVSAFGDYGGAAVVLNPASGEMLAAVSLPAFDPNIFSRRFSDEEWRNLSNDPTHPLQDRTIAGLYSPGSTFKLVSAIAALEKRSDAPSQTYYCAGRAFFYGQPFSCWKPEGHGSVSLHRAIVHSCNVYFYNLGKSLGIDILADYSKRVGLSAKTGIDIPGEQAGIVPSPKWKKARFGEDWYAGETISVSIGQGPISVTPIEQAVFVSAIANGGYLISPHLVSEIRTPQGKLLERAKPQKPVRIIEPDAAQTVKRAMWSAVNEWGTGWRAKIDGLDVCGKTGTVQIVSKKKIKVGGEDEIKTHSWFVGFAPMENPEIAFAILVEHGGYGGETAAPVARAILESYSPLADKIRKRTN